MGEITCTPDTSNLMLLAECACDASKDGRYFNTLKKLGARKMSHVCEKTLTNTDRDPHQSKLSLPKDFMEKHVIPFLTDDERKRITEKEKGGGLPVVAYDEAGRTWDLIFKFWDSSGNYVLIKDWKNIREANNWKHKLSFCTFRFGLNGKLCFAFFSE
ncbi:hypothetical protein AMTRI_Chr09g14810 [Amborella trichopoda]